MNLLWMETVLLLFGRENWILKVRDYKQFLTDQVKIWPVTGTEVFKSVGNLVIEIQVPSQQPGNSKSWVRISQGIEQHARQIISTETDHQNLEAASWQE